jgi:hypothetical protein
MGRVKMVRLEMRAVSEAKTSVGPTSHCKGSGFTSFDAGDSTTCTADPCPFVIVKELFRWSGRLGLASDVRQRLRDPASFHRSGRAAQLGSVASIATV